MTGAASLSYARLQEPRPGRPRAAAGEIPRFRPSASTRNGIAREALPGWIWDEVAYDRGRIPVLWLAGGGLFDELVEDGGKR